MGHSTNRICPIQKKRIYTLQAKLAREILYRWGMDMQENIKA
jgi:hypothetical protein